MCYNDAMADHKRLTKDERRRSSEKQMVDDLWIEYGIIADRLWETGREFHR